MTQAAWYIRVARVCHWLAFLFHDWSVWFAKLGSVFTQRAMANVAAVRALLPPVRCDACANVVQGAREFVQAENPNVRYVLCQACKEENDRWNDLH